MMEEILQEVRKERARQDEKWGEQNHEPFAWMTILGEEYGEACRGTLENRFGKGPLEAYRTELIHTAAVAVAAVECFDRNKVGGTVDLNGFGCPRI